MSEILQPREVVAKLSAYDPEHYKVEINLSANENPYDLPVELKSRILSEASDISFNRYPDPQALELRAAIADQYGLKTENVAVGNGGDELLMYLLLAYGGPGRTAVTFEPTFVMYTILSQLTGTDCLKISRSRDFSVPEEAEEQVRLVAGDVVFLCSPNNPTGNIVADRQVESLLAKGNLVVVDEAYGEFSGVSAAGLLGDFPNLAILKTFSKAFSLAGLRAGYLLSSPEVVANILKVKLPYNVNAFSQAGATLVMKNKHSIEPIIEEIKAERSRLFKAIESIDGLEPYPSEGNFILVKSSAPGGDLWRYLLDRGILVRCFQHTPGLENCLRITVGKPVENDAVIAALEAYSRQEAEGRK